MIQLFPRFACTYSIQYLCILVSIHPIHLSLPLCILVIYPSVSSSDPSLYFFLEFIHPSTRLCFVLSYYLPVSCIFYGLIAFTYC